MEVVGTIGQIDRYTSDLCLNYIFVIYQTLFTCQIEKRSQSLMPLTSYSLVLRTAVVFCPPKPAYHKYVEGLV
jgi:hypothetical protein